MTTDVQIANTALGGLLGAARISALSDDTKSGRAVNAVFEQVKDFVLKAHPWNETITRATLTNTGTAPDWGYDYAYNLPADYLRVLEVNTDYDWVVENGQILTDEGTTIEIRYQKTISDETELSPLLVQCLSLYLAYTICEEITQSTAKKEEIASSFARTMIRAQLIDAQEGSQSQFREDDWITARF